MANHFHVLDRPTTSPFGRSGAIAENFSRMGATLANLSVLSSGRLSLVGIPLTAGQVVSTISFLSATTAADTPLNQHFSLWSSAREQLAVTADDTTTAWAASTEKTLTLAAPYTVPASGLYYAGIVVVATAVVTLAGHSTLTAPNALAPILNGPSNSGLTDPASLPATANAISGTSTMPWVSVG